MCDCGKGRRLKRRLGGGVAAAPDVSSTEGPEKQMLALWDDHAYYTKLVLLGKVSLSQEETNVYVQRLLANQDHIGYMFLPKFGLTAADTVAKLLRTHIALAGDLIDALKSGSKQASYYKQQWYENADQVGAALFGLQLQTASRGPTKEQWQAEMRQHLDLLTVIVGHSIARRHLDAQLATEPYVKHIRHLARQLATLVRPTPQPHPLSIFPFADDD